MSAVRFRDGLLAGRVIAVTSDPGRLSALGAEVEAPADAWSLDEGGADDLAAAIASSRGGLDALVVDARDPFGSGGAAALAAALDGTWRLVRALATGAMIPGGRGGAIVLVAPPPGAGTGARAARAGLENLARTLSVEWSRFGIRVTAIAPGDTTTEPELADLLAWLLSPGGAYVSGALLEPGSLAPAGRRQ